ncbi:plasmid pRiA4b ORF-3 family protein [[Mycobacterium] vasticus]|uniref:Plasmid pRiA4b ORF-3 family protein n=1 Tax=[Mycobacterium] vasticus TaxID=2875777 RepID=A0ABU5YYR2_9MYCO|nr:plasmid pRiA4b ORF-3 family protein [Mycolicibacter sp. MYC017]MEB3070040.1 plasmid pRiA4b ORF-3 family protein [Mycolicibacter sp. MYC017]
MAGDNDEIRRLANEVLASLSPDELRTLTQQLLAQRPQALDVHLTAPKPPSRRRPRRKKPVTLRVRVELSNTKPALWRRLELPSDLMLDEVHQILQTAFGWTDSHLHQFGSGPSYHGPDTEYYLCPFMVEDGEDGVPEDEVRLDELLVDVGDKLFYVYDFGDNWRHVIQLEAVLDRDTAAPRAVCTGGRQPGPAEDCGGVGGYELLVAATDPAHPEHAAARAEYADMFGDDVDPRGWAPTPFDIEAINRELADDGELQGR